MKAKLIKREEGYYLFTDESYINAMASNHENWIKIHDGQKLSKENCDEIFGVVDMDKICDEYFINEYSWNGKNILPYKDSDLEAIKNDFIHGYNKAMELNDKLFTVEDLYRVFLINSAGNNTTLRHFFEETVLPMFKQPTEIDVEIKLICPHPSDTYVCGMEYGCDADGCNHPEQIPYLDKTGCLILKRI